MQWRKWFYTRKMYEHVKRDMKYGPLLVGPTLILIPPLTGFLFFNKSFLTEVKQNWWIALTVGVATFELFNGLLLLLLWTHRSWWMEGSEEKPSASE